MSAPEKGMKKPRNPGESLVGAPGFEPGTFCTPSKRATSLRYAPSKSGLGVAQPGAARNKKKSILAWLAATAAIAALCFHPAGAFSDAVYVLVGLHGLWRWRRLRDAWAHPFGLFALLGVLWMAASAAWSFWPAGTVRDLSKEIPLFLGVLGLPALLVPARRAWAGLSLAAGCITLRLALDLVRLVSVLGCGAGLFREARFAEPYLYNHPNISCMFAGLSLFVFLALLLRPGAWRRGRFVPPLLGAAVCVLYLLVLASRGPQAVIAVLALAAPVLFLPGWRPRAIALVLCAVAAAAGWQAKEVLNPRLADSTMDGFNNRKIVWQHVTLLPKWQNREWQGFGWGKRAFHKAYYENPRQRPPWVPGDRLVFPHAHSYWRMIRFEGGNVALAIWSLAWLALLLRVLRRIRLDALATRPPHFLPLLRARLLPVLLLLSLAAILLYGVWDYPDSFLRDAQFLLLALLAAATATPPAKAPGA